MFLISMVFSSPIASILQGALLILVEVIILSFKLSRAAIPFVVLIARPSLR